MKRTLALSIPFAAGLAISVGLAVAVSAHAQSQSGECYAEDAPAKALAECKPLTRAEVKAEVEKVGASTTDVGECPNIAAAPTQAGMVRTRAAVRQEAKQAVAQGKSIDLGECPQ
ncbi:MAG: hypothetical protein AB8C46_17680 [Burkholderiaceae bacterium]